MHIMLRTAMLFAFFSVFASPIAPAAAFILTPEGYESFNEKDRQKMLQLVNDLLEFAPRAPLDGDFEGKSFFEVREGVEYVRVGDMLLRAEELRANKAILGRRWPNGIVYYEFHSSVNKPKWKSDWRDAAKLWEDVANVSFRERQGGEANYIQVKASGQNRSEVGMQGGRQRMEIESWGNLYVIAHEIAHALGMVHEHQRTGRGDYVEVYMKRVQAGMGNQFKEWPTTNYGEYDFGSVMHYHAYEYARGGLMTIEPKVDSPNNLRTMGQRAKLSDLDEAGMKAAYP